MIFDLVRMKVNAARPKIVSLVISTLISGFLVSIPVPANAADCVPTSTIVGGDTVLTFTTVGSCDWDVPAGVTAVRVLAVGGGSSGGAGKAEVWWPQGGGGGAVVANPTFSVTPGAVVAVAVGAGGAAINTQGAASTSVNNGGQSRFGTITANGGTAPTNTLAPGGTSGNGNVGGASTGQYVSGGGGGAGAFLCNHVFYIAQNKFAGTKVRSGFIHVPLMDSQAPEFPGLPTMPLDQMIKAVRAMLEVL